MTTTTAMTPETTEPASATTPSVVRIRQLRGLLVHAKIDLDHPPTGRDRRAIVPSLSSHRKYDGICRWCQRPTNVGRTVWHLYCLPAYHAARGVQMDALSKPLVPNTNCPCGNPGHELDHHIAISLAQARHSRREILRAHILDNLQWLCSACHRQKTADDMRRIANLRAGRAESHIPRRSKTPPPGQLPLGLNTQHDGKSEPPST